MDHVAFLPNLVLTLGIGVVAAVAVAFLRLPAVAGFMLAGALVGPSGLALVKEHALVDTLSEIGVVLLLFTIGLEFSLERLKRIWKLVAIGGSLQVGLTTLACVAVAAALGDTVPRGVFFGFLVALSSTAIVLRGLSERGETDAPHGKFTIGALIFQDLCVIPMMLLAPTLAGKGDGGSPVLGVGLALGKAALFVAATLALGRFVVPRALARVDQAKSREVFAIAVLVFCAGIAVVTAQFGLSLALGAFLAGILLSDSNYGHRAMANVLPLRDVLTSLFFMSLGMLFDVGVVRDQPLTVVVAFAAIFFGKGFIATVASLAMKFPARVAWLAGVSLAQFGEFGFVLAKEGGHLGLIAESERSVILAAGILTMFVTPVAMRVAPHVAAGATLLRPLERLLGVRGIDERDAAHDHLAGHIVIAGWGVAGRMIARALAETGAPYVVVDLSADAVTEGRAAGVPIYYGDVTSEEALEHAHLRDAQALVLVISDMDATRQTIAVAAKLAPNVPVIVRARRVTEEQSLKKLGARDVVVEEFEAGVEMVARVLHVRGAPVNVRGAFIRALRDEMGLSARKASFPRAKAGELAELADLKVEAVLIKDEARAAGKSLRDLAVRTRTGASVIALRRAGALVEGFHADTPLAPGDVVFVAGARESILQAVTLLDEPPAPAAESATPA